MKHRASPRQYKLLLVFACLIYIFPSLVLAAENIKINQFLPNPSNEDDEYVELANPNSESIDISGYILDDEANGGSKPYKIPSGTNISANSSLKFGKAQTGIALNNSKQKDQSYADIVNLSDKSGTILDSITYVSTQTDVPISHISPTHAPTITTAPSAAPTSTPLPTDTPKPLPTRTPVPTPHSSITPTVLSSTSEVTPTNAPNIKQDDKPQDSTKQILGWSLITGGGLVSAVSLYLARYT